MYKLNDESVKQASTEIMAFFLELTKTEITNEEAQKALLKLICSFIKDRVKIDDFPDDDLQESTSPRIFNATEYIICRRDSHDEDQD